MRRTSNSMADGEQLQPSGSSNALGGVLYNEAVQTIRELLSKDKCASMVTAVELLMLNLQQQREISVLKETLQDALQQTQLMGKEVHKQPVIETLMNNIEGQNNTTRKQLQENLDSINMHIESNEMLRKQLKKELGGLRSTIDELGRRTNEKEEEAKTIHRTLADTSTRVEYLTRQRAVVSAEMAKLREEHQTKLSEQRKLDLSYEESVKKIQMEQAERDTELARANAKLDDVKQQTEKKLQFTNQLRTDQANLMQSIADLNKYCDQQVGEMERLFMEEKEKIDEMFNEANEVNQRKVNDIKKAIDNVKNNPAQHKRQGAELYSSIAKVTGELDESNNRNKELKNELAKLRADAQAAVVTNVDKAVVNEPTKTKPNLLAFGRGKPLVFAKDKNPASIKQPTTTDESEFSFHIDNESTTSTDTCRRTGAN